VTIKKPTLFAGTALANTGNGGAVAPSTISGIGSVIARIRSEGGGARSGDPLLLQSRLDGSWAWGIEGIGFATDDDGFSEDLLGIDPESLAWGWNCWGDNRKKLGEVLVPISQDRPDLNSLPVHPGFEWKKAYGFKLVILTGEDAGQQLTYVNNSGGAEDAFEALLEAVGRQQAVDPARLTPVVRLGETHYDNRRYGGVTYKPVFDVVCFGGPADSLADVLARAGYDAAPAEPAPPPAGPTRTPPRAAPAAPPPSAKPAARQRRTQS
jgi:hypothetical protein